MTESREQRFICPLTSRRLKSHSFFLSSLLSIFLHFLPNSTLFNPSFLRLSIFLSLSPPSLKILQPASLSFRFFLSQSHLANPRHFHILCKTRNRPSLDQLFKRWQSIAKVVS